MTNKTFTQAEIDEYRSFIEDQMSGYFTDAQLVEMMSGDEPEMTNKTTPKLTAAQERAWQMVLDWHKKHGQQIGAFDANSLGRNQVKETTLDALVRKGMLICKGKYTFLYNDYSIHPDYIPAAAAPDPTPAAAPAQPYCSVCGGSHRTVECSDMNAYERIILAAAETNARLEARIKELEGDMERLAASELELVQQNALLNSVVDRLGERAATLETENTELKTAVRELVDHIKELPAPTASNWQPLRVWWISNPPTEPHYVPVNTVDDAARVLAILGDYDLYLGDLISTNAGGLQVFDEGEWTEWYSEDGDDIDEYMSNMGL